MTNHYIYVVFTVEDPETILHTIEIEAPNEDTAMKLMDVKLLELYPEDDPTCPAYDYDIINENNGDVEVDRSDFYNPLPRALTENERDMWNDIVRGED